MNHEQVDEQHRRDDGEQHPPLPEVNVEFDEVPVAGGLREQQVGEHSRGQLPAAMIACAAESRAIGTRNGEHDT